MSRRESDREDLLREATALVQRVELTIPGFDVPVFAGFRRDGSASFFFGGDPVYQFNSAGQFRRGYAGGVLYKAERGRLISLRREHSATEVALVRTELSHDETRTFRTTAYNLLVRLQQALASSSFIVVGEVPAGGGLIGRISIWLINLPAEITIADVPNAG